MRSSRNYQAPNINIRGAGAFVTTTVIVIAILIVGSASVENIQPGYVGVLFDRQSGEVRVAFPRPGFAFKIPLVQSVVQYPVGTQVLTMVQRGTEGRVQGDDSIKAQSIEGQDIQIDVTIKYRVDPEKAGEIYKKWAGQGISVIEDNAVRRAARSVVPIIAGKMTVIGIYGNERDKLEKDVFTLLKEELTRDFIILEAVQIGEVHISAALKASLEQKVAAQQAAEQAKFALDKAETEAKTAAAVAKGKADARAAEAKGESDYAAILAKGKAEARATEAQGESNYAAILAKGKADARRIEADAEAYYNATVAKSLTPELVQLKAIEKISDKINVVFAPTGTTPFIGLDSLLGKKQ
jgi:regulator of protease activity HflC (stomatin/prohibitin superfamily)